MRLSLGQTVPRTHPPGQVYYKGYRTPHRSDRKICAPIDQVNSKIITDVVATALTSVIQYQSIIEGIEYQSYSVYKVLVSYIEGATVAMLYIEGVQYKHIL